jgi:hypothetical protein
MNPPLEGFAHSKGHKESGEKSKDGSQTAYDPPIVHAPLRKDADELRRGQQSSQDKAVPNDLPHVAFDGDRKVDIEH